MMQRYWAEIDGFDRLRIVEANDGEFIKHDDFIDFKAFTSGLLQGNGLSKKRAERLLSQYVPSGA